MFSYCCGSTAAIAECSSSHTPQLALIAVLIRDITSVHAMALHTHKFCYCALQIFGKATVTRVVQQDDNKASNAMNNSSSSFNSTAATPVASTLTTPTKQPKQQQQQQQSSMPTIALAATPAAATQADTAAGTTAATVDSGSVLPHSTLTIDTTAAATVTPGAVTPPVTAPAALTSASSFGTNNSNNNTTVNNNNNVTNSSNSTSSSSSSGTRSVPPTVPRTRQRGISLGSLAEERENSEECSSAELSSRLSLSLTVKPPPVLSSGSKSTNSTPRHTTPLHSLAAAGSSSDSTTTAAAAAAAAAAADAADSYRIEVEFKDWKLANGRFATGSLNRTAVWREGDTPPTHFKFSAQKLKQAAAVKKASSSSSASILSMLSSFGGMLNSSSSSSSSSAAQSSASKAAAATAAAAKQHATTTAAAAAAAAQQQVYAVGSVVRTTLGLALVKQYRAKDCVYKCALLNWRCARNVCAMAFLHSTAVLSALATPGLPVVTFIGLGTVAAVRESDGVIVVKCSGTSSSSSTTGTSTSTAATAGTSASSSSKGSMCTTLYLQPKAVLGIAKATVNETVATQYGYGKVISYSSSSCVYCVDLGWCKLYTPHGTAVLARVPPKGAAAVGLFGSVFRKLGWA
jgi:trimeric autotransporter adhesin